MKKYLLIFLILISCVLLTGCASIDYNILTDNNGHVVQTITVRPDYELLEKNGYSHDTVNERIITIYKDITISQEKEFESYRPFFIPSSLKKEILSRTKHEHEIDEKNGTVTLKNTFDSYGDYLQYYCITENSNQTVTQTPFYYVTEIKTKSIYSSLPGSSTADYVKKMFSYGKECPFTEYDLSYSYTYKTKDKLLRSNADKKGYKDEYYYHKWIFDKTNLDDTVYIYKYSAILVYNWYYTAIILAFILFMFLMIVNEIIQIYKRKKEKKCLTG